MQIRLVPDITIRSTFIVGFPGESEEDFDELLGFLDEAQLDRVGCFQYSDVDGAKANELPDAVAEEIKEERWQRFMEKQNQISAQKLKNKIGKTLDVLIDKINEIEAIGRSHADAPEIDCQILVSSTQELSPGQFIEVESTSSKGYDLLAKHSE